MPAVSTEAAARTLSADSNVVAGWLFGSAKDGRARQGADLDIGVLFAAKPGLDELCMLRGELQKALRFDEIDLVALNGSSPILRFEAACGTRIYCRDAGRCAEFVSLTAREYEDEMALLQRHLKLRR